ncbi:hypothetical protein D3C72_2312140 [compost metagenome]
MGASIAYTGSASLANGAGSNASVTVSGAVVTDRVTWTLSAAIPIGVLVEATVTSANTVTVRFQNGSGATVSIPAGMLSVKVRRQ